MSALAPGAVLFAILVAHSLLETARDALFLAELGPQHLASAYAAMAVCALAALALVRRVHLVDPRRLLVTFLVVAVVGTAGIAVAVTRSTSAVFVLYMWTGFVATLVVPTFWTAIDRSLRIGEAKRVFGAIGAGGVLGAMIGSALASALGRIMPASQLVMAGAIAFVLATVAAALLLPQRQVTDPPMRRPRDAVLFRGSRRYLRLLLVLGVVSTIVLTLGDLTFKRAVAERLPARDLASAFGAIYALLNAIALVIQLVVTPRLLARWGIGAPLAILPLLVIATGCGFAMTGAAAAVIALKLGDGGLRHSVHRVGSEILFLPLTSQFRDRWKVAVDALGQRGGQALAALLAFGVLALGAHTRGLAAIAAVAGVLWLVTVVVARRAYIAQFRDMLQAGEIRRDTAVPALDADSIVLLSEALASNDENEVIAALDLLSRLGRVPALVFYHPNVRIVRHALSLLDGGLPRDVAGVLEHLLEHQDPRVRAAALAAAERTAPRHERLTRALGDDAVEVRAVALVGLAEGGDAEVERGIRALVVGATNEQQALVHAIAYAPAPRFRAALDGLLAGGEPAVARGVLRILARAPDLADTNRLLPMLAVPATRDAARRVFLAIGEPALDVLVGALDDPATPLAIRRHLPRSISQFTSRAAVAALVQRLPHEPDRRVEAKLLNALRRMRRNDPALAIDPAPLRAYLRRTVRIAARYAVLQDALAPVRGAAPSRELLREIVVEKRRVAVAKTFDALDVLLPAAGFRSAHEALEHVDEGRRSAAHEIVEAVAPADVRTALLAVIDELLPGERRAQLGVLAPGPFATDEALIAELLADPSESVRCVAAYHAGDRNLVAMRGVLSRLRPHDATPLVAHAFDEALRRLA
jgi:AAA family ATP:ADP antiporter